MSKKISTIFLSLFLIGILSVSCSNSDKTGSTIDDSKGIEQYNGNSYVSTKTFNYQNGQSYFWVSVKDGKAAMNADPNNNIAPTFPLENYFTVTGSGTDYSFSLASGAVVGTFKFASDGSSVTVIFTANPDAPAEMLNTDIVCNKKQ